MQTQTLTGGFDDPAIDAAHAFRGVMEAMARPGTWHELEGAEPPAPMSVAAGALLLTLCDTETPIYLAGEHDCADVRQWIAFHTGAPISDRATCMFALGTWDALGSFSDYPIGTPEYPDQSATLILDQTNPDGAKATLTGPGIKDRARLALPEVAAFQANHRLFPLGLDFYLTAGQQVAALPRSTEVN